MNEITTTIVAGDEAVDHDIIDFRRGWEQPAGAHEELDARLGFETLIADLSLSFINLPPNQVDREIEDAQCRVC